MKRSIFTIIILIFFINNCDKNPTKSNDNQIQEDYTIVFYADSIGQNNKHTYTIDIDGSHLKKIMDYGQLPVWYDNKSKILYMDKRYSQIKLKALEDTTLVDSIIVTYNENLDFLRYSKSLNCLLFQYTKEYRTRIAKIDINTLILEDISMPPYDEANPNTSEVDNWIYFSTIRNKTYDIYRMKVDRSQYQPVLQDSNYNYHTFSVSADGKYIASPKYNDEESFIVIYDIDLQKEETIYQSNYGKALYTTFTKDNKYVLFIIGIPYNYSIPREIYRINKDGSNLIQLTYLNNLIGRPLAW